MKVAHYQSSSSFSALSVSILWRRVKDKIMISEKSVEAISLPKTATDVASDKLALVTEKPIIHSTKVVTRVSNLTTHWISYWLSW